MPAEGAAMTEHDRLWQGVLDEPDEDAPRLVYADWLDDHGEPERSEFIRAQVELARLDEADPRYPEVLERSRRAAAFAVAPAVPWRDHVPGPAVAFRRGTIARATAGTDTYLKHEPARWQKVPLEELVLWRSDQDRRDELARRPELNRLRLLGLAGGWATSQAQPLLTASSLTSVRDLYLEGLYPTADDGHPELLAELARTIDLPALEGLCWEHAPADFWSAFVLALRRPLRRLAVETYSDPELEDGAEALDRLVGSQHWPNLRRLGLYHHINTIGYSSVYDTPSFPRLKRHLAALPAEDLRLSVRDLPELAARRSWGNLHTLRLGHADLTDDLAPLADAPQAGQLRRLLLDYPDGPEPELGEVRPDVLASPHLAHLRHLRIDGYTFSDEDSDGLAAAPFREGLVRLELLPCHGSLTEAQLTRLLARPWPRLHTLHLGASAKALAPLLTTPHLPQLCTLVVSHWENLPEAVCADLARAPGLPRLSLVVAREAEWLLNQGTARQVAEGVWLLDRDLYEMGPYKYR
jgi:uncharacterized protein (TIGR02996 family)